MSQQDAVGPTKRLSRPGTAAARFGGHLHAVGLSGLSKHLEGWQIRFCGRSLSTHDRVGQGLEQKLWHFETALGPSIFLRQEGQLCLPTMFHFFVRPSCYRRF